MRYRCCQYTKSNISKIYIYRHGINKSIYYLQIVSRRAAPAVTGRSFLGTFFELFLVFLLLTLLLQLPSKEISSKHRTTCHDDIRREGISWNTHDAFPFINPDLKQTLITVMNNAPVLPGHTGLFNVICTQTLLETAYFNRML